MMRSLIDDERIKEKEETASERLKELDRFIDEYVNILEIISQKAIINGRAYKAFDIFKSYAAKLKGELGNTAEKLKSLTVEYLTEINERDN